ncbi:chaplin [Streptomyces sp. NPDC005262]|uniref:chaplin n=1 Tax=Streptomyces sp. NPDC005262 TaxID=3364710 RepID=UPI0036A7B5A9
MRKALSKSMLVMAAASGILTAAGGYAQADASADGSAAGSPGVGSGNAVQVPVHVPVNVCGNTVNVVGLLNPAFGNTCENASDSDDDGVQGASAVGGTSNSPGVLSGNLVQVPVDVPVNACGNTVDVVGALNPAVGNRCSNGGGSSTNEPPVVEPPVVEPPVVEPPVVEPPVVEPPVVEPPVVEPPVVEPPVVEPPVVEPPVVEPPVVEPPVVEPPVVEPPVVEPPTVVPAGVSTPSSQLARTGSADLGVAAAGSAALLLGGTLLMRRARASRN